MSEVVSESSAVSVASAVHRPGAGYSTAYATFEESDLTNTKHHEKPPNPLVPQCVSELVLRG